MKASELRVGNITNQGVVTGIYEAAPNEINVQINSSFGVPLEKVNPIPLTEEWLQKFGFKGNKFRMEFGQFAIWTDTFSEPKKNDWYFEWKKQHIKIQFIHQLQNLYFALTGEELTIK